MGGSPRAWVVGAAVTRCWSGGTRGAAVAAAVTGSVRSGSAGGHERVLPGDLVVFSIKFFLQQHI